LINCNRCTFEEVEDYFNEYVDNHYEEVKPSVYPPKVDFDLEQLKIALEHGCMYIVKAEQDDKIVGAIAGYVHNHAHYKGVRFSTSSVIQVNPKLKNRFEVFAHLIKAFEVVGKRDFGVQYTQLGLSAGKDIRKLTEKLGYEYTDFTVSKRI